MSYEWQGNREFLTCHAEPVGAAIQGRSKGFAWNVRARMNPRYVGLQPIVADGRCVHLETAIKQAEKHMDYWREERTHRHPASGGRNAVAGEEESASLALASPALAEVS